ncbi:MAG: pyruvate formate-lyase-activating protein [Bacillota bacterium]|jgi:pyruvate formate lyase activating enzyme|nr:pyruvate formate-lyase-activating protein [Bacillota bacterium]
MIGYLHSVETFGTVDNGGIRFVLFLQGCALRCRFCHNPDTWLTRGQPVTVAEIVDQLKEYKTFFDLSGGGLTVSGGEPLLQHRFVKELFIQAAELGIHRALDTAGFCRHGNLLEVLPHTDLVLFSIKVVDPEKHRQLTGAGNQEILENLTLAVKASVDLVLRYVLIPALNDSDEDASDLADLVKSFEKTVPVEVLPYHKMGVAKWEQLGLHDPLAQVPPATREQVAAFQNKLRRLGLRLH